MAIGLRGSATGTAIDGADVTVTAPGGVIQNDVIFGFYSHSGSSDTNFDFAAVTGYAELADLSEVGDTFDTHFGAYRKVQGPTPDSSVTFSVPSSATNLGTAAILYVLSGVDTTTPEDAVTTTATGTNTGIVDPPPNTSGTPGAWALAAGGMACTAANITVPTAPSGYIDLVEEQESTEQFPGSVMVARLLLPSAGAENPGTFGNLSSSGANSWAAATILVRPAIVAGSFPFSPNVFLPFLVR